MKYNKKAFYVLFVLLYNIIASSIVNSFGINKIFLYIGDAFNLLLFIYKKN